MSNQMIEKQIRDTYTLAKERYASVRKKRFPAGV